MTETQCHPDGRRFWQLLAEGCCAGMPLGAVLRSMQEALPAEPMGKVVEALADDSIDQGKTLSAAMKNQPSVFTRAHVSLVEGGELLGIVDRVLLLILEATWRCPTCGNLQLPAGDGQTEGA